MFSGAHAPQVFSSGSVPRCIAFYRLFQDSVIAFIPAVALQLNECKRGYRIDEVQTQKQLVKRVTFQVPLR
jgi:hypothetical protein